MIFGIDVGPFPQVVGDEVRFAVLHLVHAELFGGIGLDVGEFVVVIDRLNVEGRFVRLVGIVELELCWIGALVLIYGLFNMRLKSGELRATVLVARRARTAEGRWPQQWRNGRRLDNSP